MPNENFSKLNLETRIELARWLIDRNDHLRESTSSRAALVLSADALLITAMSFLIDKITSNGGQNYSQTERIILVLIISFAISLLILSIIFSTLVIVSVWKSSQKTTGTKSNDRLFFNARDTIEKFHEFSQFESRFGELNKGQILHFALGELWTTQKLYRERYKTLRYAIRLFLFAIPLFALSLIIVLLNIL